MNHAPNLTDRIARVLAGAVLGALLILGCKIETGPSIVLIQTIDLAPLAVELPPSHTADLSALSITSRGDTGTVKLHWTTTGGEITDTVNVDGIWHATYLSPATTGTYLVVVTAPSGWPAETTNVTVSATVAPVQTVVVNPDSVSLVVGTSTTLTTTLRDSTGTQVFNRVVTWKTSDPSVASVSLSGLVRTFSPGKATITATSEGKSNTAVVTVTQVPVATVTVTPASQTVFVGGSAQYTVTLKDASGGNIPTSGRVITWSSNAPATASVSNSGLATGFLVGSATITATCEGQSNSATLNIQAVSTTHAGYYVTSNASASGDGSPANPWTLTTALNQPAAVKPGDTIWVRGGTYNGSFTSRLAGVAGAPIVVRAWPNERVTILGNMTVQGQDIWFWGLEVVSPTPAGPQVNGINSRAPRAKFINMIVHDAAGTGIGLFDQPSGATAPDGEVYGSLLYNNGNINNNDHGVYVYNHENHKTLRDNISFGNWAIGLHAYATAPSQFLEGIEMVGNAVFNNGATGSSGGYDILVGGSGVVVHGARIDTNYTYRNDSKLSIDLGWYFSSSNGDVLVRNNYVVGTLEIDDWATATVTNNTVFSTTLTSVYLQGLAQNRGAISGHAWSGNTFYGDPAAQTWGYKSAAGPGATTKTDFAGWKSLTGLASAGVYSGSAPTGVLTIVRPNRYEAGRANIIVYNWDLLSTVDVDVSGILQPGDQYVVKNAQNFYGTATDSGTYNGSPLHLSTAGVAPPAPIGRGWAGPITGPKFNVYVLLKK